MPASLPLMAEILVIALATLLINIPFGYWREAVAKFSVQWFIAVHAAVPLVIAMRLGAGIDWQIPVIAALVLCYFAGQFIGARLQGWHRAKTAQSTD